MSNLGKYRDQYPSIATAGKVTTVPNETTATCIRPDVVQQAPSTPPEIRRYRKSFQEEPGKRIVHPAAVGDPLPPPSFTYGRRVPSGEHVEQLFNQTQTPLDGYLTQKQEGIYQSTKREPLGKAYKRGYQLPETVQSPEFKYGVTTKSSQPAKELLFPNASLAEDSNIHNLYIKSHADFAPGEQRKRDYNWPVDRDSHRFGVVDKERQTDGVAQVLKPDTYKESYPKTAIVPKQIEDFRAVATDALGTTKNIGHAAPQPSDFRYGVRTRSNEYGTKECLQGTYRPEEMQPEPDLGRSTKPGWRNSTEINRVFGAPSIRTDIPKKSVKSVADHTNYGDEPQAGDLLFPDRFVYRGVEQTDFTTPRPKDEIRELFNEIGYRYDDATFEDLFRTASFSSRRSDGCVSIKSMMDCVLEKQVKENLSNSFGSVSLL